jgi:ankyrin repeat protein
VDKDVGVTRGSLKEVAAAFSTYASGSADVNAFVCTTSKDSYALLHLSALNGHLGAGQRLLQDPRTSTEIDIDLGTDPSGRTALYIAASKGDAPLVRVLIDSGADVNIPNCERSSPLFIASVLGHERVVKYLMSAGAQRERSWLGIRPSLAAVELGELGVHKVVIYGL